MQHEAMIWKSYCSMSLMNVMNPNAAYRLVLVSTCVRPEIDFINFFYGRISFGWVGLSKGTA